MKLSDSILTKKTVNKCHKRFQEDREYATVKLDITGSNQRFSTGKSLKK